MAAFSPLSRGRRAIAGLRIANAAATAHYHASMQDDRFEWDDRKAASNLRKHRVSFEGARRVFVDPLSFDDPDDDLGEVRWLKVGMARDVLLAVVYTERNARIRIISARKADPDEQDRYFTQVR